MQSWNNILLFAFMNSSSSHQVTYPQYMVPYRGASKVNVEVGVTVLHSHQTIFLNTGLGKDGIFRPVILHP